MNQAEVWDLARVLCQDKAWRVSELKATPRTRTRNYSMLSRNTNEGTEIENTQAVTTIESITDLTVIIGEDIVTDRETGRETDEEIDQVNAIVDDVLGLEVQITSARDGIDVRDHHVDLEQSSDSSLET